MRIVVGVDDLIGRHSCTHRRSSARGQSKTICGCRIRCVMRFVSSAGRHAVRRIAPMDVAHPRRLVGHTFVVLLLRSARPERRRNRLHGEEGQQSQAGTAPSATGHALTMQRMGAHGNVLTRASTVVYHWSGEVFHGDSLR